MATSAQPGLPLRPRSGATRIRPAAAMTSTTMALEALQGFDLDMRKRRKDSSTTLSINLYRN